MNQSDVRLGSHTTLYTGVQKIFHFSRKIVQLFEKRDAVFNLQCKTTCGTNHMHGATARI